MSEEEKINQSTEDNPPSTEESKTVAKSLTDNNQPTTIMEVHKHPHHVTHKKKWTEYLKEKTSNKKIHGQNYVTLSLSKGCRGLLIKDEFQKL